MAKNHIQAPKTSAVTKSRTFGPGFLAGLFLVAGLMSSAASPALSRPTMSAGELTEIIREPNVGAKATNLQVVGTGPDVTVLAQKESKSGDRDLKIDAIFIARALVEKGEGQVVKVKVIFSQAEHPGRYVNITSKEINDYGSGKINAEQLLASLRLIPVAADRAPDVVAGPQFERRLLIWQRIEKLRQGGTGVEPFEAIFTEIDAMIKGGGADPGKKLSYLEAKLSDQEEAIKQAKRTARGLGVPASKNSLVTAPAPAASASPSNNSDISSNYLPPNHEFLRQVFQNRSQEIINTARDRVAAEKLIAIKKQIEDAFREGKKVEAFSLMHKFQLLGKESAGSDIFAPQGGGPGGGPPDGGPGGGGPH